MYSEALIEKTTLPALLANQLLQSWADSRSNDTDDLPHSIQPEAALLNKLIEAAQTHRTTIDAAIDAIILTGWSRARMSLPLLSVLQVCAAEAIASPSRDRATLVDEYTQVAAQLVTDEELDYAHKAFNLLLDSVRPPAA
jgi:transcription termination factor NusB